VKVRWERQRERFLLEVSVPANSTAEVRVPTRADAVVHEGGIPAAGAPGVEFLRREAGRAVFRIGSGEYRFTSVM